MKVQKNIYNLFKMSFVMLEMYLLSILINLMHPCWIKVLIALKK